MENLKILTVTFMVLTDRPGIILSQKFHICQRENFMKKDSAELS